MGSLSDPDDFGAAPIGDQRFYGSDRVGPGRWAVIPDVGLLWTNDSDAVQLTPIVGGDDERANGLRYRLIAARRAGIPAKDAFAMTLDEFDPTPITVGELSDLL